MIAAEDILSASCKAHKVTWNMAMADSRIQCIVDTRAAAMYVMRRRLGMRYTDIALFFGRTYPTVIHHVRLVARFPKLYKIPEIEEILKKLQR